MAAAAREFASRGFSGSRLGDIAQAAGVSKASLYAHFPSREDLFAAAALEPFAEFAAQWESLWEEQSAATHPDEQLAVEYVTALYDHVAAHEPAIRALFLGADDPAAADFVGAARHQFHELMDKITRISESWAQVRGVAVPRVDLRARIVIGSVLTMVLFDDWMLPPKRLYGRDTVIRELAGVALRGSMSPLPAPD